MICRICKIERDSTFFRKRRDCNGYETRCKICERLRRRTERKQYTLHQRKNALSSAKNSWKKGFGKDPDKYRTRQREIYAERAAFIADLKNVPCMDCGGLFPSVCMDFDHRGDKEFAIHANKMGKMDALLKEIHKCDVVCANCHRIRTQKRVNQNRRKQ